MIQKIIVIAVVAVLIVGGIGFAAYKLTSDDDKKGDRTVTDIRGREVTIPNEVNKVVCVSAGALRMVSYFDIDRVVGVDSFDAKASGPIANYNLATYRVAYGDKIKDMTNVGGASSFKEMTDTGADVIFTTTEGVETLNNIQEKTGIPVIGLRAEVYFDLDSFNTFSEQMKLIGEVLGMEDRADELVNGISALFTELENYKLSAPMPAPDDPTVKDRYAYVCGLMTGMNGNFYKTTGHFLPFSDTVALNIAPNVNNEPYIIAEKDIIDQNPRYIFVDIANYNSSVTTMKNNSATIGGVSAVVNEKVYALLPYKFYNTNYENELIDCFIVGSIILPSVYNYDLTKKANEIFDLFYPGAGLTLAKYTTALGHDIGKIPATDYKPAA